MHEFDTATVQSMTRALHRAYCLPGASPATAWSKPHVDRDERKAEEVLADLIIDGLSVTAGGVGL